LAEQGAPAGLDGFQFLAVRKRQNDGTYRTSKHLVFRADLPDRSFSSDEDYMVATEFHNVTYAWPQGKGSLSKNFDEISFQGRRINCSVVGRKLSVNEFRFGEFKKGDRVRLTGDGKVFVNDIEREPLGDS
ncbi:hypothetical protein ACFL5Z_19885, partial [Planctomycetota bacterium]